MATQKPTWSKDDLKTTPTFSADVADAGKSSPRASDTDVAATGKSDDDRASSPRSSRKRGAKNDPEHFNEMIKDGWTALAIKAGETRSVHDVEYDPATYKLELADDRFGPNGKALEDTPDHDADEDLPEVRVEEDHKGGWLAIDRSLKHDFTCMYRRVPEIRA